MKAKDLWTIMPNARPEAVIRGRDYCITVLTSRLFRLEYESSGCFLDEATQTALCRDFAVPAFTVEETERELTVETEHVRLVYDRKPFSPEGLRAALKGAFAVYGSVWHYGDAEKTLGGTARTLDEADGEIPVEAGIMSFHGYAALDDSASMRMDGEGRLLPARPHGIDLYLFAYGHDFRGAMKDFLRLSGRVPVVPRFALGNWWSRYYPYTQTEYMHLMETFEQEGIPLSVSVLDMNWHVTEIDPRYGTGWTGYTWDREKFPEPEKLLAWLHDHGLKVTLNDHPADGIRACEESYARMASAMGEEAESGKPFPFDAASERFLQALERAVLEPLEAMGVDFWWLDWQQKGGTTDPGMDPLFTLNHTRYLHALETGHPALILSRYGGPGSHRYPVGFSGDTCITWASLHFQPWFTATAANIGYGWWSHDIGGHMHGTYDPELTTRWVQFGVFSPIMRLHSSNNPFMCKEPWLFPAEYAQTMKHFLRIRHRLLPWLYTQNVRCSEEGEMLLRPLYYEAGDDWDLYFKRRNQYLLGDCLTVCPVTQPMDPSAQMAETEAWLPEGIWTDFFTGWRYRGGRKLKLYRPLNLIPVLVRPGGIIPMDGAEQPRNGAALPEEILLRVFPNGDGETELIEDNGLLPGDPDYRRAVVRIRVRLESGLTVEILPAEGDESVLPENRRYTVELNGVTDTLPDDASCAFSASYDAARRTLTLRLEQQACSLHWEKLPEVPAPEKTVWLEQLLYRARIEYDLKNDIMRAARQNETPEGFLAQLHALELPQALFGAILERMTTG
ncbi:MAG: hypothetical protein IKE24_11605 [Clostridia bacterium]|nr:hypothetical protein [Clostridia bacterium]